MISKIIHISISISVLFASGCIIAPTDYPEYDANAIEKYARIVSKSRQGKLDNNVKYQVKDAEGNILTIETTYPAFKLNDCVVVFMHDTTPPNIAYATDCPIKNTQNRIISIVSAKTHPDFGVLTTAPIGKAEGLSKGISGGAAAGAVLPLMIPPGGVMFYPVIAPLTIVGGAIAGGAHGSTTALTDDLIKEVDKVFHKFVESINTQEMIKTALQSECDRTGKPEVLADQYITSDLFFPGSERTTNLDQSKVDTLEVGVVKVGFDVKRGIDPQMSLVVILKSKYITQDKDISESNVDFIYQSNTKSLKEWSAEELSVLKKEFTIASEKLAKRVHEEYFQ